MIYTKCNGCKQKRLSFTLKYRTYDLPVVGMATSKEKLCPKCYRAIKRINKKILEQQNG